MVDFEQLMGKFGDIEKMLYLCTRIWETLRCTSLKTCSYV